jgi:hypothetical protein
MRPLLQKVAAIASFVGAAALFLEGAACLVFGLLAPDTPLMVMIVGPVLFGGLAVAAAFFGWWIYPRRKL